LVLRNVNTGQFEAYNIANNQITGAVSLGTADASNASTGSSSQVAQIVQAMAGFDGGSGAGAGLNTVPIIVDTSQQQLLTAPQHA
jgi:hypothetical protein